MDRLIASGTVAAEQADTAPAGGTPGFATDGNPASQQLATQWPAYQYNAFQEEMIGAIIGGSLTPDRTKNTQLRDAIRAMQLVSGQQGRLSLSGGNALLLPYKGNLLFIPGQGIATIPAGGASLSVAGLTVGSLYYIYATIAAGSLTLLPSTTGHSTDATGVEIMTGDNTKALVGMGRVLSGTWEGTLRSWMNDPGFAAVTPLTSSISTTSMSFVEISSTLRTSFLLWAGEIPIAAADGQVANTAGTSAGTNTSIAFDGTAPSEASSATTSAVANANMSVALSVPKTGLSEGFHYATAVGLVGGGTATWAGTATQGVRFSVKVYIAPRK
ncbi:hypothetical protein GCM10027093_11210 [Paraburkholderia jirisanensis]